jgi:hypothetical protein
MNTEISKKLKNSEDYVNKNMEKFAINLENVKKTVLFDCILEESAVARKYDYKDFYTNDQEEPENWYEDFMKDIRLASEYEHKGEKFYVVYPEFEYTAMDTLECHCNYNYESICYIFFREYVYSLDNYYTDCPIFSRVLKNFNSL